MLRKEDAVKLGVIAVTAISIVMALSVKSTQAVVEIGTTIIAILSALLAVYISASYARTRALPLLFWAIGLWLFTAGVVMEVALAFGMYSLLLIDSYLLIVTLLVEFLALGSLALKNSRRMLYYYSIFIAITALATVAALAISSPGLADPSKIISSHVVYGVLPLPVIAASSLATFPAAIILIVVAAQSYLKRRSMKMISIILGVIVVSIAGTLYIVAYPVLLYFSEFVGILLLWLGFV